MSAFEDQIAADVAAQFSMEEGVEQVVYTSGQTGAEKTVPAIIERGRALDAAGSQRRTAGFIWIPAAALAPEIDRVRRHDTVCPVDTDETWRIDRRVSDDLGMIEAELETPAKSRFRE